MKHWLAILVFGLLLADPSTAALAARVLVTWEQPPDPDLRSIVFMGPESRPGHIHHPEDRGFRYAQIKPVRRATRFVIEDLQVGETRALCVVAIDALGRSSDYSEEIILTLAPDGARHKLIVEKAAPEPDEPRDQGRESDTGCSSTGGFWNKGWLGICVLALLRLSVRRAS